MVNVKFYYKLINLNEQDIEELLATKQLSDSEIEEIRKTLFLNRFNRYQ